MLFARIIRAFCMLSILFEEIVNADNTKKSPFLTDADYKMAAYLTEHPSKEPVNNTAMYMDGFFEGDISGTERNGNAALGHIPQIFRNAIRDKSKLWKNARVPYIIHQSFYATQRGAIAEAVKEFHDETCIRFKPWNGIDDGFVHFKDENKGCNSPVGTNGHGNTVNLGRGCFGKGTIMHEILHTLGFHHEHNRPDRDEYVEILWDNIQGSKDNFLPRPAYEVDDLLEKYDYTSLMHYDAYAFGGGRQTIKPKDETAKIGQRAGFSEVDLRKVKKLYSCDDASSCSDRDKSCDQMSVLCDISTYVQQLCPNKCLTCTESQCKDRGLWCKAVKKYKLCDVSKTPIHTCPKICDKC